MMENTIYLVQNGKGNAEIATTDPMEAKKVAIQHRDGIFQIWMDNKLILTVLNSHVL